MLDIFVGIVVKSKKIFNFSISAFRDFVIYVYLLKDGEHRRKISGVVSI